MSKVSRRSLLGWLAAAPFIGASVSKVISDAAAEEITDEMLLAGQRATDPVPLAVYPGGITWVDVASEERTGVAFDPVYVGQEFRLRTGK